MSSASELFAPSIQVNTITGNPGIASSPFHIRGADLSHCNVNHYTVAAVIPAAALVDGFLTLAPNGAGIIYTLPTAAAIVAAFTAAGSPLAIGNVFEVGFQLNIAANTGVFAMGANLTAITALETITVRKSGVLIFIVTNVSSGTEALSVALSVSSA
jgi:hypothetical protein